VLGFSLTVRDVLRARAHGYEDSEIPHAVPRLHERPLLHRTRAERMARMNKVRDCECLVKERS
jgi:hypothetical protein